MGKLEGIFSEQELMSFLNLTKAQLTELREEGLRFIRVNRVVRLYAEQTVVEFLMARETQHMVVHRTLRESEKENG